MIADIFAASGLDISTPEKVQKCWDHIAKSGLQLPTSADIFAVEPDRYSAAVTGGHRWRMEHELSQRKASMPALPGDIPELPPLVEAATAKTEALKPAASMPAPAAAPTAATIEVAPKKPKPAKQPKPAPEPPPVLSKQNQLGFHESTIKRALETWQPKGTPQQLISHLGKHQGANQEAELTGLHDFLKDKPSVTREDVLAHLQQTPHKVQMEEHGIEDSPKKWQVVSDNGEHGTYDTEEEAERAAQEFNDEDQQALRDKFSVKGDKPHYTVDANQLELLEEKEQELGGEMDMAASRALQRLQRTKFESEDEAKMAVDDYLSEFLPKVREHHAEELGRLTSDPVEEHSGGFTVRSPLSRSRHNQNFGGPQGNGTYESKDEAQDAIDEYVSDNFESPYSHQEVEDNDQETYEQYSLEGPKSNYNETHVAIPGIRVPQKPLIKPEDLTAKLLRPGTISIFDKDGKEIEEYEPTPGYPGIDDAKFWIDRAARSENIRTILDNKKSISWKDGHGNYQHIDNPVVRIRHDDRETTDGKKMFMVEELQGPSDTNQEKMPKWIQDRIYDIGLKRALTKAVQGGYQRMGWSRGEHIADHYNLAKRVDRIEWHPGTFNEAAVRAEAERRADRYTIKDTGFGFKPQAPEEDELFPKNHIMMEHESPEKAREAIINTITRSARANSKPAKLMAFKDGREIMSENVEKDKLPEYVGKDLAAKMLSNPAVPRMVPIDKARPTEALVEHPTEKTHFVEGQDLEIGGIGLKQLYDRDLHKRLLDIKIGDKRLKNLGVKIGTSGVPTGEHRIGSIGSGRFAVLEADNFRQIPGTPLFATPEEGEKWIEENPITDTVHSIDITPELAAEIKKHGVSLYRRSEGPERYDRAMLDVVRRMPSHEAAIYALGLLQFLGFRPDLMRTFTTEDLAYLRSLVHQQIRYEKQDDIFRVE